MPDTSSDKMTTLYKNDQDDLALLIECIRESTKDNNIYQDIYDNLHTSPSEISSISVNTQVLRDILHHASRISEHECNESIDDDALSSALAQLSTHIRPLSLDLKEKPQTSFNNPFRAFLRWLSAWLNSIWLKINPLKPKEA